jgi:RNA polymerase sigma-70 factor (ECF subfamily)
MPRSPEIFLSLLQPHYSDALRYCQALCKDRDDALDVLQHSFVLALEKIGELREEEKFKSWYFKIITRTFYSHQRTKFWLRFLPLNTIKVASELPDLFEGETENARSQLLHHALSLLKPKERAAILLFEVGNFPLQQIAEIQGEKSVSAVKSRLTRTRQKLKEHILSLEEKNSTTQQKGDLADETQQLTASWSRP